MKRAALAPTLILALIFSVAVTLQLNSVATANPYTGTPFLPPEPNTDPPIVTVQSPSNITYHENDVPLNFTVIQPDSWLQAPYNISCWIKGVEYEIDGQVVTLYEPSPSLHELPVTKQFSTVLTELSEGQHTLQVKISAESQYDSKQRSYFFEMERYPLDVSQTIIFNVDTVDDIPEFPSWTPLLVMLLVLTAVAVIYKRKLHELNQGKEIK